MFLENSRLRRTSRRSSRNSAPLIMTKIGVPQREIEPKKLSACHCAVCMSMLRHPLTATWIITTATVAAMRSISR